MSDYTSQFGASQFGGLQFGSADSGTASDTISPDGFTRRAFGTPSFNFSVYPTGFTRRAFGRPQVGNDLHVDGFTRRAFGTPTITLEASPTGFTRRAFGTPTISVNIQVGFQTYGFSRRAFGIPSFTGPDFGLSVYIAGTDRAAYVRTRTMQIDRQLNTTGTIQFDLVIPVADSFRPALGSSVIVSEAGRRIFSGYLDQRKQHVFPNSTMLVYTVHGVDWWATLQRRRINYDFSPQWLPDLVNFLLVMLLAGENIVPGSIEAITCADSFKAPWIKASDLIKQIQDSTNTIAWVDVWNNFNLLRAASLQASAYSISDSGGPQTNPDTLSFGDSLANYRNKQYVRTPGALLTANVTLTESHTFSGAAEDIVCPTTYPLIGAPISVKENGVEIAGTTRLFQLMTDGSPTAYPPNPPGGYYWAIGFFGVFAWPSNVPPTAGTVLQVQYTGQQTSRGNVVAYADSTQIGNMAAAMGTTGIFEELEDYQGSITYDDALALATGIEQATAPPPFEGDVTTVEQIEDIGRKVTVNLTQYGISEDFIIQRLSMVDMGADLGKGTRFQSALKLQSARSLGNWLNWFERLLARLSNSQIPQVTEKIIWNLAIDTPEGASPDLSAGVFGATYPIQHDGQVAYASACFQTATGSQTVIDIAINGVSIFDGAKLTYTAAQTGTTQNYANLSQTPFQVKAGDLVQLTVASVDVLQPGKNGIVVLVLEQQS